MAPRVYPAEAHSGPFVPGSERASLAGKSLGYKAVPIIVKGDWAEFATALAFRSWSHIQQPCFKCFATKAESHERQHLTQVAGLSVVDSPWAAKTMTKYEAACDASETTVTVHSEDQLHRIVSKLAYDKRRKGGGKSVEGANRGIRAGSQRSAGADYLQP